MSIYFTLYTIYDNSSFNSIAFILNVVHAKIPQHILEYTHPKFTPPFNNNNIEVLLMLIVLITGKLMLIHCCV